MVLKFEQDKTRMQKKPSSRWLGFEWGYVKVGELKILFNLKPRPLEKFFHADVWEVDFQERRAALNVEERTQAKEEGFGDQAIFLLLMLLRAGLSCSSNSSMMAAVNSWMDRQSLA